MDNLVGNGHIASGRDGCPGDGCGRRSTNDSAVNGAAVDVNRCHRTKIGDGPAKTLIVAGDGPGQCKCRQCPRCSRCPCSADRHRAIDRAARDRNAVRVLEGHAAKARHGNRNRTVAVGDRDVGPRRDVVIFPPRLRCVVNQDFPSKRRACAVDVNVLQVVQAFADLHADEDRPAAA